MALELLAGPFTVIDRVRGEPLGRLISGTPIWIDGVGLALPITNAGIYLVQLDGTAYRIADDRSLEYGLALQGEGTEPLSRRRAYAVTKSLVTDPGDWDLDTITYHRGRRIADTYIVVSNNYARLHDRYVRPIGGRIDARPLDLSTGFASERSFPGLTNATGLSWGTNAAELVIGATSGQFVRYDWVRKVQVGASGTIGMSCRGLWYAARYNVFVSLHDTGTELALRVWAATVRPSMLTAPLAASPIVAGRRTAIQCQVLGADGEPCVDEIVAWRLVGPGSLALGATVTDAAGRATTYYEAPLDASGAIEIHAELAI